MGPSSCEPMVQDINGFISCEGINPDTPQARGVLLQSLPTWDRPSHSSPPTWGSSLVFIVNLSAWSLGDVRQAPG